ncbi:MAG: GNAT family N-acetyltransferase [Bacteroidaceae bacterium]|nr:GNAT family N-acetyltransferase [Bacteroidaceae bacterium]
MERSAFLGKLVSYPLTDFQCLNTFSSGVESMDKFIRGDFRLSVENHYCQAYVVKLEEDVVAIFALSFDSLDLDPDDKEELQSGFSSTASPDIDYDYQEIFYAKPRYPAMDIAYLAIQEKWKGKHIGDFLIKQIADLARRQTLAGCQFLTVEALATKEYSAVGFYERCGFSPNEVKKPYKDTLRMYMALYSKDE